MSVLTNSGLSRTIDNSLILRRKVTNIVNQILQIFLRVCLQMVVMLLLSMDIL